LIETSDELAAPQEPGGFDVVISPQLALGHSRLYSRRAMCDKCVEIHKKIEHHRLLASRITDQPYLMGSRN